MKTLRSKLFVSVGSILLIFAILNYVCSSLWIRKELEKASLALNQQIEQIQNNIRAFTSFILTYQIVQGAAELDGISKIGLAARGSVFDISPTLLGTRIAAFNPQISFVQVRNASGYTVTSPENAVLYVPEWAVYEEGILWVRLPKNKEIFAAISDPQEMNIYHLFDAKTLKQALREKSSFSAAVYEKLVKAAENFEKSKEAHYQPFTEENKHYSWRDSPDKLFAGLLWQENIWVEKIILMRLLATEGDAHIGLSPQGILKADLAQKYGVALLRDEAFTHVPIIEHVPLPVSDVPTLALRKNGDKDDLDMIRKIVLQDGSERELTVGFSLSAMIKKVAEIADRKIIAAWGNKTLGFTETGKEFNPLQENFPVESLQTSLVTWQDQKYIPRLIDLDVFQLYILTPQSQALAVQWFLKDLGESLALKITLSLTAASCISFLIALLLLNRISKKITGPIVMLSKASEELSKGKYEGLVLPRLQNRHDEIEVLTHAFEGMVVALSDRDKIRGVLNKVVSKEITEEILKHNIELGGEERTLTILFSDIRGFTRFAEGMQPKAVIEVLNAYMTHMCRIIDETSGVVDKFVGDEIMALYGAPLALIDHPIKAIEAAIKMIGDLRVWNEEREKAQLPTFEIGIGIHTGIACTGNMGAENRLNYTAIGSNVNLASRLCNAAGPMQILISEAMFNVPGVREQFNCNPLPSVILKGIDHEVAVYEVLGYKRAG